MKKTRRKGYKECATERERGKQSRKGDIQTLERKTEPSP